jgi:predicted nucleic acid-binding protein
VRLLDTDVCVDIRRRHAPAVQWAAALTEAPGLPGFVLLELMRGVQSKREMAGLLKDMALFHIYWPTTADCDRAVLTYARAPLSHRIGILDLVIGECAVGLGATLCTFNVRHFRAIPVLITEQPYARSYRDVTG